MTNIQNYRGFPLRHNPYESWMEHWHKHSDQWIIWCSEVHCKRLALVASLVKIIEKGNDELYVVPLCKGHAASDDTISIGDVKPVRVNL
jgi:hypothetical protein